VFVILFALLRSFTLAGLLALVLTPFGMLIMGEPLFDIITVAILVLLVIFAHRENLRTILQGRAGASRPARPLTRRGE